MKKVISFLLCLIVSPVFADNLSIEARIEQGMQGSHRSESNIERNRYRHPVGTLSFLGLEDGMTVMEIWPGGGWYTEILAPTMRHQGQYIVAAYDVDVPDQPDYRYRLQEAMLEKFANAPELYDQVAVVGYSPPESASLGERDSLDMILTFRNAHGWVSEGIAESIFAEFARVLKPGGILGVVQHRAAADSDPKVTAEYGYVSEKTVVELARSAGLYLEARSEVNANPKDSTDHAEGVWSLPPSLAICGSIEAEAEKMECQKTYQDIGESDRMTLRFRKPIM